MLLRRQIKKPSEEAKRIRELISTIRRMWRKGPDAPARPKPKPNGIIQRAVKSTVSRLTLISIDEQQND